MAHHTAAESLARDQHTLGQDYGAAYHHARQELWRVSSNWDRYECLFGSPARVELVNASSGHFWYCLQLMLFDQVLLGLCRLTDPPSTGRRQNLTLEQLLKLEPSPRKTELRHLVQRAWKRTEFARSWRNRRIAHNDLDLMTGVARDLAPATRNKVRKAIIAIHDVLRWIGAKHFNTDLYLPQLGDNDANQILVVLADGVAAKRQRREAFERGDYRAAQAPSYPQLSGSSDGHERYSEQIKFRLKPRRRR